MEDVAPPNPPRNGEANRLILPELVSGRGTARHSRVVEGKTRLCFVNNPPKHRVSIVQHVTGRYPQSGNSRRVKPGVSSCIAHGLISAGVAFAIDLDCKSCVTAEEIQNVRTARVLAAELQSGWALPETIPEDHLRKAHFAAKAPSLRRRAGAGDRGAASLKLRAISA